MSKFTSASFCMDGTEGRFEGYTEGDTWNGWECPYFEFSEAQRVLKASEKNGFNWSFNEVEDVFIIRNKLDAPNASSYEVGGQLIDVDGKAVLAYPIGAYDWIWEQCSE